MATALVSLIPAPSSSTPHTLCGGSFFYQFRSREGARVPATQRLPLPTSKQVLASNHRTQSKQITGSKRLLWRELLGGGNPYTLL